MSLSITREERREKSLLKKREQIIFLGFKKEKKKQFPNFLTKIGVLCKQACYYFDAFFAFFLSALACYGATKKPSSFHGLGLATA